jgi:hypothetical protein
VTLAGHHRGARVCGSTISISRRRSM